MSVVVRAVLVAEATASSGPFTRQLSIDGVQHSPKAFPIVPQIMASPRGTRLHERALVCKVAGGNFGRSGFVHADQFLSVEAILWQLGRNATSHEAPPCAALSCKQMCFSWGFYSVRYAQTEWVRSMSPAQRFR